MSHDPHNPTVRGAVLHDAMNLTLGDRNKAYGDPTDNHENIARLMDAYLGMRGDDRLDAEDAAMLMVCVKMARIAQRLPRNTLASDSFIDAAAYIAIAAEARATRLNLVHPPEAPSNK